MRFSHCVALHLNADGCDDFLHAVGTAFCKLRSVSDFAGELLAVLARSLNGEVPDFPNAVAQDVVGIKPGLRAGLFEFLDLALVSVFINRLVFRVIFPCDLN